MSDILNTIIDHKAVEVASRRSIKSLADVTSEAASARPTRGFVSAIDHHLQSGRPAIIAEVKKASPSKGVIREDFDPSAIAQDYEHAGATCLSVLTDEKFFQGGDQCLIDARSHCSLPVIRKDFIIDPYQVYEARAIGADAILLIVSVLEQSILQELSELAASLSLDVLVEVHDKEELDRALQLPNRLLGINNRNLRTFETSLDTTINLLEHIDENRIVVTESGIHSTEDVILMQNHSVNTFLVGEAFMRSPNPGDRLAELFQFEQQV